jgi:D-lactate dehydrogenase
MKIAVFSAKPYDRDFLDAANARSRHELTYFEARLTCETAALARGFGAVCCFVNDELDRGVLEEISAAGVRLAVLRCAGFNNVDLEAARDLGMSIGRVPAYSPNAVAEHMFALLLTLIRKTHRAYNRVREGNFSLDGLLGFDLSGKTVGIVGLGAIGSVVAKIAMGFGCRVIAFDPYPREECENAGVRYCPLEDLLARSDIITLHCPLDAGTRHLIDAEALARMKSGAILVNTSRGAVVDTRAVIEALKSDRLGGLAIDVYEEEEELFFEDRSRQPILDDLFARLLTFPNVIVTGHQGFFTREALTNIAETTLANVDRFDRTGEPLHPLEPAPGPDPACRMHPQQYLMS